MKRDFRARLLAGAIATSAISLSAVIAPAIAQSDSDIGFDYFHDQLAQYGDWVYSDRWGEVWQPVDAPDDFRPYDTDGHWAYANEYGWTWVSDYEWGDIPFHYGRWINDPDDGWLWIPGYTWGPGWVVWRSNARYTGWMPMPPDQAFLSGQGDIGVSIGVGGRGGLSVRFNDLGGYYGYSRWYGRDYNKDRFASNWIFVGSGHLADRDYRRYAVDRGHVAGIIQQTRNVTNYAVVNNYVVNRSINVRSVERAGGHRVQAVRADAIIRRPNLIATVAQGHAARSRMHERMSRGTGLPNSAPKPTAAVIKTLSPQVVEHNGHAPAHLMTRDTAVNPSATPATDRRHKGPPHSSQPVTRGDENPRSAIGNGASPMDNRGSHELKGREPQGQPDTRGVPPTLSAQPLPEQNNARPDAGPANATPQERAIQRRENRMRERNGVANAPSRTPSVQEQSQMNRVAPATVTPPTPNQTPQYHGMRNPDQQRTEPVTRPGANTPQDRSPSPGIFDRRSQRNEQANPPPSSMEQPPSPRIEPTPERAAQPPNVASPREGGSQKSIPRVQEPSRPVPPVEAVAKPAMEQRATPPRREAPPVESKHEKKKDEKANAPQ